MTTPFLAALSDRIGRKRLMLVGALGFAIVTYPAFVLLTTSPQMANLVLVQCVFAAAMATYGAPAVAALAELFPTQMRCTAVGLVFNITVAFVGGTAQVIVTWLLAATGNSLAPAFYVMGAAIMSLAAVIAMRDRFREPLP